MKRMGENMGGGVLPWGERAVFPYEAGGSEGHDGLPYADRARADEAGAVVFGSGFASRIKRLRASR